MLHKVEINLKFNPKRNYNLKTPCCNRNNMDGKYTNYLGLPDYYGFCHSCGKSTIPPTTYIDEEGLEFIWNKTQNKFESFTISSIQNIAIHPETNTANLVVPQKFIDEAIIWNYFEVEPENNLLQYLRRTYGDEKVDDAKETYSIGSTKDGGTVFWNINNNLIVQKAKIAYYDTNGKRTNNFKVPYKNDEGYTACLFGEHLISYSCNKTKTVILVESEKTAIVGYILLPQYIWIAYGGSNGLTLNKLQPLIGQTALVVPDISETAVNIMYDKISIMISLGINAKIWDMTDGKSDSELKNDGIYNNDLEDVFRKLI